MGSLNLAVGPARAADDLEVPLDTHSVPAELLGVSGRNLVTTSEFGGTHVKRTGEAWTTTNLDRGVRPADVTYVDGTHLVALVGTSVQVLDIAGNTAETIDLEEGLWTATATTAVKVSGLEEGRAEVAAFTFADTSWRALEWPEVQKPPLTADPDLSSLGQGWVSEDAWIAPMVYVDASNLPLVTDLDVVPLAGTATPVSVRVPGTVLWAGPGTDPLGAQVLRYVSLAGRTLSSCTASGTLDTAVTTCRTMKTKVTATPAVHAFVDPQGTTVLGVTVGTTNYLWQSGKLVKVTSVPSGSTGAFTSDGAGTRPVLAVKGRKPGFYEVATSGKAKLTVPAVVEAVSMEALDLGASWVVGIDNAANGRGWVRSVGAFDTQVVLSKKAAEVSTSGRRYAVNGGDGLWFYSDGVRTAKLKAAQYLESISGPYALVVAKDGTSTLRTESSVVASGIPGELTALFGSLVARVDLTAMTVTVNDYAKGRPVGVGEPPAVGFPQPIDDALGEVYQVDVWGDWVMLAQVAGAGQDAVVTTTVVNYLTGDRWQRALTPINLGDGVVSGVDVNGRPVLWDFRGTSATAVADVVDPPVASAVGAIAFTNVYDHLVVSKRADAGGASAPRALGTTAGTGTPGGSFAAFDGWRIPWKVTVEATKALAEGTLRISDPDGAVIAERTVAASASGAITATWDGLRDSDGFPAETESKPYTWALDVPAADGTGALQTLVGGAAPGGPIDVQNTVMPYPQVKPRINDSTPVVGQVLTANPGPLSPNTTFTYKWFSGTTPVIEGQQYTVAPSDLGKKLSVRVTVDGVSDGPFYYADTPKSLTSSATAKVGKGTISALIGFPDEPPTIGSPYLARISGWQPSTPATPAATYQWYRVDTAQKSHQILGATTLTYTPGLADLKYRLKLVVKAKAVGYKDATISAVAAVAVVTG